MRVRKNVNYFLLNFIISLTFISLLNLKKRQNEKDIIDSLCEKFPTLAQGMFDKEALQFLDIER